MKLVEPVAGTVVHGWAAVWGGVASYLRAHQVHKDGLHIVYAGPHGVGCGKLLRQAWTKSELSSANCWGEGSWYKRSDGETKATLVADLDENGTPEILTGNETGFLVCYGLDGTGLWKRLVGTPVNALLLGDVIGGPSPELIVAGSDPALTLYDVGGSLLGRWHPRRADPITRLWRRRGDLLATTGKGAVLRIAIAEREHSRP